MLTSYKTEIVEGQLLKYIGSTVAIGNKIESYIKMDNQLETKVTLL